MPFKPFTPSLGDNGRLSFSISIAQQFLSSTSFPHVLKESRTNSDKTFNHLLAGTSSNVNLSKAILASLLEIYWLRMSDHGDQGHDNTLYEFPINATLCASPGIHG